MEFFKDIHIGSLIHQQIKKTKIKTDRICNFFKCTETEIEEMYLSKNLSTDIVLGWCKLLEYDFFRIYTQHLILYAPPATPKLKENTNDTSNLPQFRKNIYTKEMIDFILELLESGEKTKQQVTADYKIPRSTLYKWVNKYRK